MQVAYDKRLFNETDPTMEGIWDAIGAIGASGVQLLPGLLGGGGSAGGPAKGLAAITSAVNQALASLNQLLQSANSPSAASAALTEAQRIEAALSNPANIYQAQRGKDAEVLKNGKTQAAAIVAQIRSRVGSSGGPGVVNGGVGIPTVGSVGDPLLPAPPTGGSSIDTSTLLLIGGGLALVFLLKS